MSGKTYRMSREFITRRLHSLFGLWIVLFLMEHLFTNSQAALLLGENGKGFVKAVNFIKGLPFLPVVEVVLIGVPILFHMVWGVKYLLSSKSNAFSKSKAKPTLRYGRNRAYSWQRIASWVLLVGLILHVGFMRFYRDPVKAQVGNKHAFFIKISMDKGLYAVADKLDARLWSKASIETYGKSLLSSHEEISANIEGDHYSATENLVEEERLDNNYKWAVFEALSHRRIKSGQVVAETKDFGTAELLMVRDTFKSVFNCMLYTVFVLAAVFHGFNGLWTFLITWGVVLKMRSQSRAVNACIALMFVVGFLGLSAIWGTYFFNLKH
ncbi:succinate dehydrogenase [Candidatus Aerophobetes bacterium]|uniref:Succinate dehydrogenase n=1 Tax=Aerophobetes bacterium TaxID=2030807 RepID=A0A2A4X488_UNCAE|nr:MAG: succinate dehydrogenase [Candidatus Aerophobetes bacterium]